MESRNDKVQVQELEPEQLEKVIGGEFDHRYGHGLVVCNKCGAALDNKHALEIHILEKHPEEPIPLRF